MKTVINGAGGALLLLASLSGCAHQPTFAPMPGDEQVSITIKVPQDLAARSMRVMYRSAKCPSRESANGVAYEIDGFYPIEMQPQRLGQSDLYEVKLDKNGGGACQWKLSNVTFGISYQNTERFGPTVQSGRGGGVIAIFDDNLPQQRSYPDQTKDVTGNLLIKEDYYPWVDEEFLGSYAKQVRLLGSGDIYLTYRTPNAQRINFEPVLHTDYVVYSAGPKVKKEGNHTQFTYPDGSIIADGSSEPDFDKLQAIRLGQSH
ncbi:hypothetical protein [Pseudomonas citronellolis]|uniref:hypothetical protein n=1 Tax=Pseudomonas citronellolis TaxID=53408 RepID=UPI0023E40E67|nr:hypothetical protein [Pseudomonas citronellolis]MDF3935943.1 hypothetical protein [Pseudomonas citronellolis]